MQDPAQEGPLAGEPARHQTTSEQSTPAGRGNPAGAPAAAHGMTRRQASAIRTREILIETGLRLAERTSLAGLSINLLVEAGVAKGTFSTISGTARHISLPCTANSTPGSSPRYSTP